MLSHEVFQKTNEWIRFYNLCKVFLFLFWKKLKTPKRHFEIIWPLIYFWLQRFFWGFSSMLMNNQSYLQFWIYVQCSKKCQFLFCLRRKIKSLDLGEIFVFYNIIKLIHFCPSFHALFQICQTSAFIRTSTYTYNVQ